MVEQGLRAHLIMVLDAEAEDDDRDAGGDEGDDRDDLDERKPELQLTEDLHSDQTDRRNEEHHGEHPDPPRHLGEPEAHVHADRGGVEDGDEDHFEGEGPADEEAGERVDIAGGVLAEGAGDGVADDEFAEGAHDHEDGGTADDVGEQYGWSGRLDRLRRTHEEAGADGRTEGHETDVASGQASFQACVLPVLVG